MGQNSTEDRKSALHRFRPKVVIRQPSNGNRQWYPPAVSLPACPPARLPACLMREIHTAHFTDFLQVTFVEKVMKLFAIQYTWKCLGFETKDVNLSQCGRA
jgi:hypothetical protein